MDLFRICIHCCDVLALEANIRTISLLVFVACSLVRFCLFVVVQNVVKNYLYTEITCSEEKKS